MPSRTNGPHDARAVVLCEHHILREAIELWLKHHLNIRSVQASADALEQHVHLGADDLDLVILVSLASTDSALRARWIAALAHVMGRVPLLVICEQPLEVDVDPAMISYLPFPFDYDRLCDKASDILAHTAMGIQAKEMAR
jgi:hypothetical protein